MPMLADDITVCWEATMSHLRLVPPVGTPTSDRAADDRPRVSLRLLMAASGRCSCDACVIAFRLGDRRAGIVSPSRSATRLTAVR
jgi:hypothetical protein